MRTYEIRGCLWTVASIIEDMAPRAEISEDTRRRIANVIDGWLEDNPITRSELARRAGVDRGLVAGVLQGRPPSTKESIRKVAKATGDEQVIAVVRQLLAGGQGHLGDLAVLSERSEDVDREGVLPVVRPAERPTSVSGQVVEHFELLDEHREQLDEQISHLTDLVESLSERVRALEVLGRPVSKQTGRRGRG